MNIKELKAGQGKVDIEASVKSVGEIRRFEKYGRELKVANAVISDESGEISLSLWNDDAERVKAGDKVKITNGYVSEFQGKIQLTSGKFGKLEILDGKQESAEKSDKKAGKVEDVESDDVAF